jgi:hypothetical protein
MADHLYRFRSIRALVDEFHELENQQIYFSPPSQLNDPLEDFKDIVWIGDHIDLYVGAAWINNAGHKWRTRMVTKSALNKRYPTRGSGVSP